MKRWWERQKVFVKPPFDIRKKQTLCDNGKGYRFHCRCCSGSQQLSLGIVVSTGFGLSFVASFRKRSTLSITISHLSFRRRLFSFSSFGRPSLFLGGMIFLDFLLLLLYLFIHTFVLTLRHATWCDVYDGFLYFQLFCFFLVRSRRRSFFPLLLLFLVKWSALSNRYDSWSVVNVARSYSFLSASCDGSFITFSLFLNVYFMFCVFSGSWLLLAIVLCSLPSRHRAYLF